MLRSVAAKHRFFVMMCGWCDNAAYDRYSTASV